MTRNNISQKSKFVEGKTVKQRRSRALVIEDTDNRYIKIRFDPKLQSN